MRVELHGKDGQWVADVDVRLGVSIVIRHDADGSDAVYYVYSGRRSSHGQKLPMYVEAEAQINPPEAT